MAGRGGKILRKLGREWYLVDVPSNPVEKKIAFMLFPGVRHKCRSGRTMFGTEPVAVKSGDSEKVWCDRCGKDASKRVREMVGFLLL